MTGLSQYKIKIPAYKGTKWVIEDTITGHSFIGRLAKKGELGFECEGKKFIKI